MWVDDGSFICVFCGETAETETVRRYEGEIVAFPLCPECYRNGWDKDIPGEALEK